MHPTNHLCRPEELFRIGQSIVHILCRVFALLVQDLQQPLLQVIVTLAVGQLVHQDYAVCGIVESIAGVLVAD